jgi:hypothetical protein
VRLVANALKELRHSFRVFQPYEHVRKVAVYFALLVVGSAVAGIAGGAALRPTAMNAAWLLTLGASAIGLLALLAWAQSRATVYTITSRRVVMRFGVAIPMTMNIPFSQISSAALRLHADGTGDVPLALASARRASYLVLWPHVRPWHFGRVQPMLRAVADAGRVAEILARALSEAAASDTTGLQAANDASMSAQAASPAQAPLVHAG